MASSNTVELDVLKQHQFMVICATGFGISEKSTMARKDIENMAALDFPKQCELYMQDSSIQKPTWLTSALLKQKKSNGETFNGGDIWRKFKEGKANILNIWSPAYAKFIVNGLLPSGKSVNDVFLLVSCCIVLIFKVMIRPY